MALYLGTICAEWSAMEMLLSHYYTLLVFGERDIPDPAELTVIEAFESITAFGIKRSLLMAAAKTRLPTKALKKLSVVLNGVKKAQEGRNALVHGRWFYSDDYPGSLIRRRWMIDK